MEENGRFRRIKILLANFGANFSNILIFIAIIYFLVVVGKSTCSSYKDQQDIEKKKQDIENLQAQVIYLQNQNLYYQTASFKEKEARKKLGMVKPGETAVALDRTNAQIQVEVIKNEQTIKTPNYVKWWQYFFGA